MGTIIHNAVIATTWNDEAMREVESWINGREEWERALFVFGGSAANRLSTVVLVPDGSKEGWPLSDQGDQLRRDFIARLGLDDYEDGSSPWKWVEVEYGEFGQSLMAGNCRDCMNEAPADGTQQGKEDGNG